MHPSYYATVPSLALCRHYFALPTNPGEQFYAFTNLAAWLLNTCGKKLEQPQEVGVVWERILYVLRYSQVFILLSPKCMYMQYQFYVHIYEYKLQTALLDLVSAVPNLNSRNMATAGRLPT